MNRRSVTFRCNGATLVGSLDSSAATGSTGLLIVSGGNEIRSGSWGGQAQLAAQLAATGVPVFRFDRRGIGESEGENRGFRETADDISAALEAFRAAAPQIRRIVAFGNCDAASALMLHAEGLSIDALVLANPWTVENDESPTHDPASLRRHYLSKLKNPRELLRLITGKVNFGKLLRGLRTSASVPEMTGLAQQMATGLASFGGPVTILLASRDRTAQLFAGVWPSNDQRVQRHESASHSFSEAEAREWLFARLTDATASRH